MAALEPTIALTTCENALRELMGYVYNEWYGPTWLNVVATDKQRGEWVKRAEAENARTRRGVAAVDDPGLAYANFYDLLTIADKHWEQLAPALDKKQVTYRLLERFEQLRNAVAHGRTLLTFERDLFSGVAGQIRNQVTHYMSSQDPAGEYYPRIESVLDSLGHRIDSQGPATDEVAGYQTTEAILHPGERVGFTAMGTDPQDRPLRWDLTSSQTGLLLDSQVSDVGQPVQLEWLVDDGDVTETGVVQLHMYAEQSKYRRFGRFDHRAFFGYIVRPPSER
ncbi:hypothetical protein [Rhodococcus opacus]|uniref:Swt1-like HEPN domain-containing protein n=1 Tax=Rhodococcus opacus TaxID=37919 RepID=A0AAX3YQH6_RHOOP|nr:hypothetical protein [Rhodococcus opacus]WLF51341.1 hypothetical protein Q5707_37345 [Rhodococcus opacus]